MKRDSVGKLLLLALVVGLGTVVGVTRFPDALWVKGLSRAAIFGPWIDRLAEVYRQSSEAKAASLVANGEGGVEVIYRLDLERYEARPMIFVAAGSELMAEPSRDSNRLSTVGTTTNVKLFEQEGDWYLVRHDDVKGWVYLPDRRQELSAARPPLGSAPAPPLPLASRPPDAELLDLATSFLADSSRPGRLGPYSLYTDVEDRDLLEHLDGIAGQVDRVYAQRYGVSPIEGVSEAIVLFATEVNYREFRSSAPNVSDLAAPGFVQAGVVATFAGRRAREEVAATLLHELTHLVNKRALGPALPPWLEEGLASDIGQSAVNDGVIVTGKLGGSFQRSGMSVEYRGGRAAAIQLQRALDKDQLDPLETLLALDWSEFHRPEVRSQYYAQSSFFVRSLLDSPDPELARGFRSFLAAVAQGKPLTDSALRESLGRRWSDLDRRLASFVRLQAFDEGTGAASGSSSRQSNEPSS